MLTLNWDDELRNDWEYLVATMFKHVMHSLASKELIWVLRLTQAIKEQRQVVVVVQLLNFNLVNRVYVPKSDEQCHVMMLFRIVICVQHGEHIAI